MQSLLKGIFHRNRKKNPEIYMKPQRPQLARAVLRKKNNAEDTTLPDLKLPYNNQYSVTRASKNRHMD